VGVVRCDIQQASRMFILAGPVDQVYKVRPHRVGQCKVDLCIVMEKELKYQYVG
jgi:hypothetical protein